MRVLTIIAKNEVIFRTLVYHVVHVAPIVCTARNSEKWMDTGARVFLVIFGNGVEVHWTIEHMSKNIHTNQNNLCTLLSSDCWTSNYA